MVLEINSDNFEQVISEKKITLLQFSADWCGPCKMLTPIILKISEENKDKDITIAKVNVDNEGVIGAKYGIRKIPSLVFLKDGVEVERTVELKTQLEIQAKIDLLLN